MKGERFVSISEVRISEVRIAIGFLKHDWC